VQSAKLEDLRGGDRETNATIIRRILAGEDRSARRDAVLINAAAALFVAGKARTMDEGWVVADEVINSGDAKRKLAELCQR
jgi:anthranilate phosphoribosyltransferase